MLISSYCYPQNINCNKGQKIIQSKACQQLLEKTLFYSIQITLTIITYITSLCNSKNVIILLKIFLIPKYALYIITIVSNFINTVELQNISFVICKSNA